MRLPIFDDLASIIDRAGRIRSGALADDMPEFREADPEEPSSRTLHERFA